MFQPDYTVCDRKVQQGVRKTTRCRTQAQHYTTPGALHHSLTMRKSFIFPCPPSYSPKILDTVSFVARRQGSFENKNLLLYHDGIFLWSCKASSTVIYSISNLYWVVLLFVVCVGQQYDLIALKSYYMSDWMYRRSCRPALHCLDGKLFRGLIHWDFLTLRISTGFHKLPAALNL